MFTVYLEIYFLLKNECKSHYPYHIAVPRTRIRYK